MKAYHDLEEGRDRQTNVINKRKIEWMVEKSNERVNSREKVESIP